MDGNIQIPQESFSINNLVSFKNIVILLIIIIAVNIVILDAVLVKDKLFGSSNQNLDVSQVSQSKVNTPIATSSSKLQTATASSSLADNSNQAVCSQTCLAKINEAEARLNKSINALKISPAPARIVVVATPTPQAAQSISAKEYYVPLGTGTSKASDWQGVPGAQAYVNSTAYPSIKNVTFEVSLHIPNANQTVNARLYNVTDSHAISGSDLTFISNGSSILNVSSNINLDSGNKLYQVQVKTQLQYDAVVDQSRIHITLQ